MKKLVRFFESLNWFFLLAGLIGPLALFFWQVAPWQLNFAHFFAAKAVRQAFANSLLLAAVTSVSSTMFAFGFSWLLWRYEWPARSSRALGLTLKIPYLLPAFFFAMGWIA